MNALKKLSTSINNHEKEILSALKSDLNKSEAEGYLTEIGVLKGEIKYHLKHLHQWAKPVKVRTDTALMPAKCYRMSEPYGVVLIMAPWNYPLLLSLEPLVGAISAGNCATIKPSAYSPATSAVIAKIVAECFQPEFVKVVEGGRVANAGLLEQKFDYIFFTGGTTVGRLVMESAAKNLTPVSLELGGKSPVIVDENADINMTAKKLVFGKYINAGQTCVAPDYVLVHESRKDELLTKLGYWISKFYPANKRGRIEDYPKIINEKHFQRLCALLNEEKIYYGGRGSEDIWIFDTLNEGENLFGEKVAVRDDRTIIPVILPNATFESKAMQEEIFGPILPIITYHTLDEVIEEIRQRPKPLALYLFTNNAEVKRRVLHELSFGGGCVNDTLMHVASSHLPFGGVGNSGIGSYHGKASFDTFTHYKSIVDKGTSLDPAVRYRPYTLFKRKLLRKLM
ncbi:MAG: aldehyde dehydrogenase [Bacteroidales bacterium]|nr:aldehyde dehydrogenase [Bacteroidales bacterium]